MTDDRVQPDEGLTISRHGDVADERWAITSSFWMPLGARVELNAGLLTYKVVQWFSVLALCDPQERRSLECDFELPPDEVIDEAAEAAPTGRVFLLRCTDRW